MTLATGRHFKPGFQESQLSSVEAIIYTQRGDPVILTGEGERDESITIDGRTKIDQNPSLTAATTSKVMGGGSGNFSLTLKPSRKTIDLYDRILDDDWVDIVFTLHNRKRHVMRALVDDMRKDEAVGGTGATTETYTIVGRDFPKIWENTQVWFSVLVDDVVTGGVSLKVFGGAENVFGNPSKVIKGFLEGFLQELGDAGRAVWAPPPSMPNIIGERFITNVTFDTEGFTNDPARTAINSNYMMPQGNLWALAQEWSDPDFCELFADTMPIDLDSEEGEYAEILSNAAVDQTEMRVVFRDRPFPTVAEGDDSPYFKLPLHVVPKQWILNNNTGRSGIERYNAFFMAPQIAQELLQSGGIDLYQPLWDKEDILRHGLRRCDVTSKYSAENAEILNMSSAQREKIRDWYCLNPYMLNGTIALRRAMPWVHIGERIRIPGDLSRDDDQTFYIEGVSHAWAFGTGTRTTLNVTRGWRGTDASFVDALGIVAGNYEIPPKPKRDS